MGCAGDPRRDNHHLYNYHGSNRLLETYISVVFSSGIILNAIKETAPVPKH